MKRFCCGLVLVVLAGCQSEYKETVVPRQPVYEVKNDPNLKWRWKVGDRVQVMYTAADGQRKACTIAGTKDNVAYIDYISEQGVDERLEAPRKVLLRWPETPTSSYYAWVPMNQLERAPANCR